MTRAFAFASLAVLSAFSPTAPRAEMVYDMISAELMPGWRTDDGHHMAAVRLELAAGWKTFWRAPGDAGIPARFDLTGSENVDSVVPIWPRPGVFSVLGMRTIGYENELILPLQVSLTDETAPSALQVRMDLGVCKDVCVPAQVSVSADLPEAQERDGRIVASLVDVPFTAEEAGVGKVLCEMRHNDYGVEVVARLSLPQMPGTEHVVIEAKDPKVWAAEPRSWWDGSELVAETELSHVDGPDMSINGADLRFTVITAGMAVDIHGCAPA